MKPLRPPSAGHVAECIAVGAVCGLGLLHSAAANPPLGQEGTRLRAIQPARPISAPEQHAGNPSAVHFDLRAPADYAAAATPSASFRRSDSDGGLPLPALGANDPRFRMMSRSATFVDRARREGLPFARLWESRSALLSLGLNTKGKPGLWLTQKTR
jgi:hypothetical protein